MRENPVQRRLNEQAREAMASILLFDISDPKLRNVTITGCKVSPDRGHCAVFFEAPKGTYDATLAAFKRASGAIRACLSKQLGWRVTPALQFILDESVDDSLRISKALTKEAKALSELAPEGEVQVEESAYRGIHAEEA